MKKNKIKKIIFDRKKYIINKHFKISKGLIILIVIFFCILSFFSNLASWATQSGDIMQHSICPACDDDSMGLINNYSGISGIFNLWISGPISFVLIIIIVIFFSKRTFFNEFDSGTISFWITKAISFKNLIISKIYFIYSLVLLMWLSMFVFSLPFVLTVYDNIYIKYIIIEMINYLFLLIAMSSIIVYSNLLMNKNNDWFGILWTLIIIYILIIYLSEYKFSSKFKYINVLNLFPHFLKFSNENIYKKIIVYNDHNDNNFLIIYWAHEKLSVTDYIHLCISYSILVPGIFIFDKILIPNIWKKIDFNV